MAKASYAPMFETVSGALNKIDKKSPHAADQKMVLATHRKAPTTSPDCSRVYLRDLKYVTRTTPVTARKPESALSLQLFRQPSTRDSTTPPSKQPTRQPARRKRTRLTAKRPCGPTSGLWKPPPTIKPTKADQQLTLLFNNLITYSLWQK